MANLLDSVKEYLHPGFIAEAAEFLGEGDEQTSNTLFAWCSTILAGLLNWVGHDKAMGQIFNHLDHFPPNLTDSPKTLLREGNLAENDPKDISGQLLGQLFGDKTEALIKGISELFGAKPEHVSYLLGVSGPVVLSILGQRIQAGNLSQAGLSNLLSNNRDQILTMLPAGIGDLLELRPVAEQTETETKAATNIEWVLPLLLLLGFGGAIMVYLKYWG